MSENIASDKKATIVSSVDRVGILLHEVENELGIGVDPKVAAMAPASSDKINGVIGELDSIHARLNDVLASVSGIG